MAAKSGARKPAAPLSRKVAQTKTVNTEQEELDNASSHLSVTMSSNNTTPIPPIETVMRGSMYPPLSDLAGTSSPVLAPSSHSLGLE